jgi:Tfp pilus assembly protein PilV
MQNNNQKGFSIVEAITSIFVFSVVALIVAGLLVQAMNVERRAFSAQAIQENVLAVLELMAKEIRVSNISDQNNNCTTDPALNTLTITHPIEGMVTYSLNGGVVERTTGGITHILSSDDVVFNSLRFCISGSTTPSDNKSARVTVLLSISNKKGREILTTNIHTTVTSRDIVDELQN